MGQSLSITGRVIVLFAAFLGWLCAGMHMSITQLAGRAAAIDLLDREGTFNRERFQDLNRRSKKSLTTDESEERDRGNTLVGRWFAWYQCAFLFGAATGGLVFGWLGDRIGRVKGMAASILTYSGLAAVAYFAQTPLQLLLLWYLACTGVGGMWPNGVALVSEAWSGLSRSVTAGLIGTSANIGIFLLATAASWVEITPQSWRWVMLVGASPLLLGLIALVVVPESPRWLLAHSQQSAPEQIARDRPMFGLMVLGIALATIPLIGGWGTANWMIPWADNAGQAADPPNPFLKANVQQARALTGIIGSLLGGWIAVLVGRRRTYFLVSLASLLIAQYTFWFAFPTDRWFLVQVAALGFVSGIYFGWLPLLLPELFPTRMRSTGAGVSFNFGRILTAVTIFIAGALMEFFRGDYARIGRVTSLLFIFGMIAICFAPDTSRKQIDD